MGRKRSCELCGDAAALCVDVGTRLVALCAAHAHRAERAGASSLTALRALFVEPTGRRSLLGRRAARERRLFPPRPEGRRRQQGRRQSDAVTASDANAIGRRSAPLEQTRPPEKQNRAAAKQTSGARGKRRRALTDGQTAGGSRRRCATAT
ncbi:MAG TPA: hypothetical protein VNN80_22490 [Polyangiaceae bacterium]|nr:hypothetical protein [Polyangiaceae bacterium]